MVLCGFSFLLQLTPACRQEEYFETVLLIVFQGALGQDFNVHCGSQGRGVHSPEKRRKDQRMAQTEIQQINRLADIGLKDYGQDQDVKMFTRMMLQTVIPRKTTDKREILIRNGHWEIGIQAGMKEKLPSGSLPRLILIWTIAEAIRTQSRTIYLGSSLAEFMEELGISDHTGGRWGSITRVKTAARRLFNARVSIFYTGPEGYAVDNIQFADRVRAYWTTAQHNQLDIEGHAVELHELFFKYIVRQPFPLDMNILKALARSPLGIDLYVLLAYRMWNINKRKKPVAISWRQLHQQLGQPYTNVKRFAQEARRELKKIELAWPSLRYETPRGRLIIRVSRRNRSK